MKARPCITLPLIVLTLCSSAVMAQLDIEGLIVETYYISDANDATDITGGTLVEGSRTYRVYLDLSAGCSLRSIYGGPSHALKIESTAVFFNNEDRGRRFGHEVSTSGLRENTVALDSWLTMSAACTQRFGILKVDDPDGAGTLFPNDGGSANIPGGLLANADPDAGIPLTVADGLVPLGGASATPPGFNFVGDDPNAVLGDENLADAFITNDFKMLCLSPGVTGPTSENRILIAQLTTTGTLTMELNVEVQRADGTVIKYVADGTVLGTGEVQSGFLTYPPTCGCTDPNFLEFDPAASCDDGSCQTTIVFGCLDSTACNFNPGANFNVNELCCYGPSNCNGLDITLICPDVSTGELDATWHTLVLYPNPAHAEIMLLTGDVKVQERWLMHDATGREVLSGIVAAGAELVAIDIASLIPGAYHLVLTHKGRSRHARFVKL
ncbi:MAG: T9SS type A sorting domain-containing protein [Flavobacteriales bacterium]|nr:T9SS type A sorting domain-containing protein [Flavobacteriales bacterium]